MELSPKQQINELIKSSQSILVVSHAILDGDALGAMLALEKVLTKMGKEVSLVASEKPDEIYAFLPGISKIKNDVSGTRDLILRLDTEKTPIEKLSYNREDKFVNVLISPKNGKISQSDIEFVQGSFKFDLVFVLDTSDVDKIDTVYDRHTELFFETPIINIDHHAGNEYFGTVNLIDLTATSTCEILVSIIESFGAGNFDEDVATCLLTGITYDTGSFKNINTTPKSLTISAQMLATGARQQEIIQNLYKTHSLKTLKFWGDVLSKIEYDADFRLAWSKISDQEMTSNKADLEDVKAILDNILISIPNIDIVLILAENSKNKITGLVKSTNGGDVLKIAEIFGGKGQAKQAQFEIVNASLEETANQVLAKIREIQGKQLGRLTTKPNLEKEREGRELIYEKREKQETVLADFSEDPISKAIESIDNEIETQEQETPGTDFEETKNRDDSMKPLGSILENHQPGAALETSEEVPPQSSVENNDIGNQDDEI